MKILQITSPANAAWTETPRPQLHPGEVLLKIEGVTTCPHWDLHILDGIPMFADRPLSYPYTPGEPGHEAVGRIVEIAPDVTDLQKGMRVAAWRDPGGRRQGAYAELMPIEAEHVLPIPEDLPLPGIASLELAMCVQASFDQLINRHAVAGKRFAVAGLGPGGLIAVQLAKAYGAREVIGIDPLPSRRNLALTLGADLVLQAGSDELPTTRFDENSLDAAIDTTGLKVSIEYLMQRTRETVAIFGVLREEIRFGPDQWWGNFALLGYNNHYRAAADRALEHVLAGRLNLTPLVTTTLPLSRYADGVSLLRDKEAIKVLYVPE